MSDAAADPRRPVLVLRESHDNLLKTLSSLDAEQHRAASYCDDWTIAQVSSHLGSSAEIGLAALAAARAHEEPDADRNQPIWDTWDARSPSEQVAQLIVADTAQVEAYEALDAAALADAHTKLFGFLDMDGSGLAALRLGEHAFHTWDIQVALDPSARLLANAVEIIMDGNLPLFAAYLGKPQRKTWSLSVTTTDPDRLLLLASDEEKVTLEAISESAAGTTDGTLRITGEAFLRLVYGRLDDDTTDGAELDSSTVTFGDLLATFPGI